MVKKKSEGRLPRRPIGEAMDSEDVIGMRLNKFVAHCGVASRRNAAEMVKSGKIMVNDEVVTEPFTVKENDVVKLDGKVINPESKKCTYYSTNQKMSSRPLPRAKRPYHCLMEIIGERVAERIFR
ncbi:MAG: S4 domain-containing protein [Saprospiraceae bacterium]